MDHLLDRVFNEAGLVALLGWVCVGVLWRRIGKVNDRAVAAIVKNTAALEALKTLVEIRK